MPLVDDLFSLDCARGKEREGGVEGGREGLKGGGGLSCTVRSVRRRGGRVEDGIDCGRLIAVGEKSMDGKMRSKERSDILS